MQIVPLGSNEHQISKKGFGHKDLTLINKLTLKTVINEELNTKTSNKRKKALIRPYSVLYTVYSTRQGVQRLDGALLLPLHRFSTIMHHLHVYEVFLLFIPYHHCYEKRNILGVQTDDINTQRYGNQSPFIQHNLQWLVTQKPKRTVFQYCKSMLTVSKRLENC